MSVEVRWVALPNHQRPSRALYQRCAPAGSGTVEIKGYVGRGCTQEREIVRPGSALVRGERPRYASVGISGWTGGIVRGCQTNSGGRDAGGAVGLVRVPMKG